MCTVAATSRGPAAECGRLRQGAGGHPGGDRCPSVTILATIYTLQQCDEYRHHRSE